jgi:predicted metal-dependent phosphoesterase TrpH
MSRAIFAKPNISKLKADGYYYADMHFHTRYSDGLTKVKNVYKRCKKLGIGVAITDHNEVKGALKIVKYKDILAIPGIETTTSEGIHTLFYFYNAKELAEFHGKVIEKNRSIENPLSDLKLSLPELFEQSRKFNCRVSTAHPFGPWNTGIHKFSNKRKYKKTIRKIDFVEAINSSTRHESNKKAIEWGKKIGKQFTGGSDGHASMFLGKTITATKERDFLESLKKNSLVIGTEVNPALLSLRHLLKLKMFSRFPKFYLKKFIRYNLSK